MAKGRKTGGRQKGTPNKSTGLGRLVFLAAFERKVADLERWITETGDGFQAIHFLADGTQIPYMEKNPAKAAELLTRLAEYHLPKQAAVQVTGAEGGAIRVHVDRDE